MRTDTVRIGGPFRVHKAEPARPRREHPTFEAAEAEAGRLLADRPDETFVIAQIVARVRRHG
jgi:hypothetical protein